MQNTQLHQFKNLQKMHKEEGAGIENLIYIKRFHK